MENKPGVWRDFISSKDYKYDNETYEKAINGNSELGFFKFSME